LTDNELCGQLALRLYVYILYKDAHKNSFTYSLNAIYFSSIGCILIILIWKIQSIRL